MKCLGLDLGTKTLGLAISDRLGMISSPYKTLKYNEMDSLINELISIIEEEKIDVLVLGLPKNMNNTLGSSAERVLEFKELLSKKTDKEIILIDERLTTMQAEKYLIESNMRRDNRKKVIDSVAASIILDSYLRRTKDGN